MSDKVVVISFDLKRQIEIARIAIDGDKENAIEFVKKLNEEITKKESSGCGVIFDIPVSKREQ
jgi:benzoyl-CoA reductase/2-hydroxyglutaryl-CoA dehydratase subunit BcrC/BadD/HgdB